MVRRGNHTTNRGTKLQMTVDLLETIQARKQRRVCLKFWNVKNPATVSYTLKKNSFKRRKAWIFAYVCLQKNKWIIQQKEFIQQNYNARNDKENSSAGQKWHQMEIWINSVKEEMTNIWINARLFHTAFLISLKDKWLKL